MKTETQDLAWRCLPREARNEIKDHYFGLITALNTILNKEYISNEICDRVKAIKEKKAIYEMYFGHHNLTSSEEPSELLFVEREKVTEEYKTLMEHYRKCDSQVFKGWLEGKIVELEALFGDKCLPDKEPSVQGEPRFKVGELIMSEGKVGRVLEYDSVREFPYLIHFPFNNSKVYRLESELAPYTEPETKDNSNMEEEELNLCEILRDYKGEKIYILSHGYMTVVGLAGAVVLEGTGELGEVINLRLNDDGTHIKGTEVIAFPSRALYEKYPLDAPQAWWEWQESRKSKYIFEIEISSWTDGEDGRENENYEGKKWFKFDSAMELKQASEAVRRTLEDFHKKHTEL